MTIRFKIRTVRTLYRIWDHRRKGHVLIVDPSAVTCSTCGQPTSAPPCSRNPTTGKGGHTHGGGVGAA